MKEIQAAARLHVHGRVQGVGYRFFAQSSAETLGLEGWVRNRPDGTVEGYAVGGKNAIEAWINHLRKGPSMARIDHIDISWETPQRDVAGFTITS